MFLVFDIFDKEELKMNAQELLEFLLAASNAGFDLRQFDVLTRGCVYDGLGQGEDQEIYPEKAQLDDGYLILD